ncbi:MAG: hypothetical protein KDD73_02095 [Anaerolineales bacterium]|nr:hypothetical protein [Anaerolineales bacterium]MCB9126361.1 hypothetical protein [Ardenticatenales bacterium]
MRLWQRWVAANAISEMVGLGLTFALIGAITPRLDRLSGALPILAAFVVAVLAGLIEATAVGWAQWKAMRPWFPTITLSSWWRATAIGALLAYILGYLPSTLMALGAETTQTTMAEPPQAVVLFLAAALGMVGGAMLAFAQWRVLRRHIRGAALWLPAHMLAWAVGMPLIFWGLDRLFLMEIGLRFALGLAGLLLLTGAIVGAIHGLFLVRMVTDNVKQKGVKAWAAN